jgi:hypothetical protein
VLVVMWRACMLTNERSWSLDWRMVSTHSWHSGERSVPSRSEVMPMMAFKGVRISWDMVAAP